MRLYVYNDNQNYFNIYFKKTKNRGKSITFACYLGESSLRLAEGRRALYINLCKSPRTSILLPKRKLAVSLSAAFFGRFRGRKATSFVLVLHKASYVLKYYHVSTNASFHFPHNQMYLGTIHTMQNLEDRFS